MLQTWWNQTNNTLIRGAFAFETNCSRGLYFEATMRNETHTVSSPLNSQICFSNSPISHQFNISKYKFVLNHIQYFNSHNLVQ